ncbi:hypothetical protein RSOLAG22IIIB_10205 [Rhizoctonia solani]|uniref:Nudix hydrolase domain-containing protein n=1 Tax=Rhizoctonia solani TaxID=456999 RepID=A0A0K6G2P1_9AGAM|nr:hypothetical protein RSOLAG22IIIB_10205 [Rhizoctonia solani]
MPNPGLLDSLSSHPEERVIIQRLASNKLSLTAKDCTRFPLHRQVAVLVLLFVRDGHIRVLLPTRSKSLRSYPGQVALPRGRCNPEDGSMVKTAFRLLVTPVIAWAASSEFVHELRANEREGDEMWGHPLEAMLSPELVRQSGVLSRPLSEKNTEEWPYESDVYEANGCGEPTVVCTGSVLSQSDRGRSYNQLDFVTSVKYATEDLGAKAAKKAAEQRQLA